MAISDSDCSPAEFIFRRRIMDFVAIALFLVAMWSPESLGRFLAQIEKGWKEERDKEQE